MKIWKKIKWIIRHIIAYILWKQNWETVCYEAYQDWADNEHGIWPFRSVFSFPEAKTGKDCKTDSMLGNYCQCGRWQYNNCVEDPKFKMFVEKKAIKK